MEQNFFTQGPGQYSRRSTQQLILFAIRSMLALAFAAYFGAVDGAVLPSASAQMVIAGYWVLQTVAWLGWLRHRNPNERTASTSAWLDIAGIALLVLNDAGSPPPSLIAALVLLGAHGAYIGDVVFTRTLTAAAILSLPVIAIRQLALDSLPDSQLIISLLMTGIALCIMKRTHQRLEHFRQRAAHSSERDPLTGLLTGSAFEQSANYLHSLQRRSKFPLVFMLADIENLENINVELGHHASDMVLKRFATSVEQNLRVNDVAARLDDDRFAFIVTDSDVTGAEMVALRLQHEIAIWADQQRIDVSVSFGLSVGLNQPLNDIMSDLAQAVRQAKRECGQPGVAFAHETVINHDPS